MSEACNTCGQPSLGHPTFCESRYIPASLVLKKLQEMSDKKCSCHQVLPVDRDCKHDSARKAIAGVNLAIGELRTALG